ncbi:MAG: DUF4251 domain-containing protein [Bacteroidales bacterium]|nr:DUF4251 domain-containing protein [Bacteroidales bacterium]
MKNILFITLITLFGLSLNAQETKTKKELKAEKKAQEIAKRDAYRKVQEQWVDNKTFVLEAQQVYNKIGEMFQLTPSTNFVHINGDQAVIQLSFNSLIGWNGVGGITIKGKISKYKVDYDNKNKPIYIRMTVQGSEGFQDITMWISSNGNGEAEVVDLRGNRIKFTGDVVSLEDSHVFIGSSRP